MTDRDKEWSLEAMERADGKRLGREFFVGVAYYTLLFLIVLGCGYVLGKGL